MQNKDTAAVVGAGLAGAEAAWQIANAGHRVRLFEMKPVKFSPGAQERRFCGADLLELT